MLKACNFFTNGHMHSSVGTVRTSVLVVLLVTMDDSGFSEVSAIQSKIKDNDDESTQAPFWGHWPIKEEEPVLFEPFDWTSDNVSQIPPHSMVTPERSRHGETLHDETSSNTANTVIPSVYSDEMSHEAAPFSPIQPQEYGSEAQSNAFTAPSETSRRSSLSRSTCLERNFTSHTEDQPPVTGSKVPTTDRFTCASCVIKCQPVQRRYHSSLIHEPLKQEYFDAMISAFKLRKIRRADRQRPIPPYEWLGRAKMDDFLGTAGADQAQVAVVRAFRRRMKGNYYAHSKWCGECQDDHDRPEVPFPTNHLLTKDDFQEIFKKYGAVESHFEKVKEIISKLTNQRST